MSSQCTADILTAPEGLPSTVMTSCAGEWFLLLSLKKGVIQIHVIIINSSISIISSIIISSICLISVQILSATALSISDSPIWASEDIEKITKEYGQIKFWLFKMYFFLICMLFTLTNH